MKPPLHAVGIDIGGTKIAVGVVAADGCVRASRTLPTESWRGASDATERIAGAVRSALRDCDLEVPAMVGVGIGCAGPIVPSTGIVANPHTLPGWEQWNIVESFHHALGVPVWLETDADVAAIGEYYYGAGRGVDRLVMLTIGTGVGGAVVIGGEIYRGAGGEHPEIGHIPIANEGVACYCGRNGCLESLVSGPAIAAAGRPFGFADAAGVFAAGTFDAQAQHILAGARRAVEAATWTLLHGFLPEKIVLGGGLVEAQSDFFVEAALSAVRGARLLPPDAVTIAPAQLGNLAGMVGAARWALDRSAWLPHPTPTSFQ